MQLLVFWLTLFFFSLSWLKALDASKSVLLLKRQYPGVTKYLPQILLLSDNVSFPAKPEN